MMFLVGFNFKHNNLWRGESGVMPNPVITKEIILITNHNNLFANK